MKTPIFYPPEHASPERPAPDQIDPNLLTGDQARRVLAVTQELYLHHHAEVQRLTALLWDIGWLTMESHDDATTIMMIQAFAAAAFHKD